MAHPGGRPLKFQSLEELQEKIDLYFAACDPHLQDTEVIEPPSSPDEEPTIVIKRILTTQVPYTITGLALALDTSRETLLDYEGRPEFSDAIKKAKLKCHNYTELQLLGKNPTGSIFSLKNNYGWKDKTETDITSGGESIAPVSAEYASEFAEFLKQKTKQ